MDLNTEDYEDMKKELLRKQKVEQLKKNEQDRKLKKIHENNQTLKNDEMMLELKKEIEIAKMQSEINVTANANNFRDLEYNLKKIKLDNRHIAEVFSDMIISENENIEFCFLVDCTKSMSTFLNEIKNFISEISRKLKIYFDNIKIAFIGYRHYDPTRTITITVLSFAKDISQLQTHISQIKCEKTDHQFGDVFGGIEGVINLNWNNKTRKILFHIGCTPCHGRRFHNEGFDNFPDGDPRGLNISKWIKKLISLNIQYYFCAINMSTFKMIDEFNKELALEKGELIKVLSYQSMKDFSFLTEKSLLKITTNKNIKDIKKFCLDSNPISWSKSSLERFKATYIIGTYHGALNKLNKFNLSYSQDDVDIWIANKPFSKGSLRYAYNGLIDLGSKEHEISLNCVYKESISNSPKYNCLQFHQDMIEIQKLSRYLAHEFNKISGTYEKIRVIDVDLILINDKESFYTIEEFIDGQFVKWTNNAGAINKSVYVCLLHAFSHWTYQATNNYLMVTDLQGK